MALVRAIARSGLKDLVLVAGYGGPDVGILAASGKIRKLVFAFVNARSLSARTAFPGQRQAGAFEVLELDEARSTGGCGRAR